MLRKNHKLPSSDLYQSGIEALVMETRHLLEESTAKDLCVTVPGPGFPPEISEIFGNLSGAINNYRNRVHYDIMKYRLANRALNTGLWDMDVVDGDPVNPDNTFRWSDEFRRMLGFSDENDFPNKLNSWSDRIHPEDKERTLEAFARHLLDTSGRTPYNLRNRLKMKNGEYRHFQALGDTMRDESGRPIRVAGLLRDISDEKAEELNNQLKKHLSHASELIEDINKMVLDLDATIDSEAASVSESSAATEKIVSSLRHTSEISMKEHESIKDLIENVTRGQDSMRETIQSVHDISKSVDGIAQAMGIISAIAANTNLLSMNAAIEAAHAGKAGTGFAVVAGEIRRLSDSTRSNSLNISRTLKNIITGIVVVSKQSGETDSRITEMSREINGFAKTITGLITTFNELAAESSEVTAMLNRLKENSTTVKTGYSKILAMIKTLLDALHEMAALAGSR